MRAPNPALDYISMASLACTRTSLLVYGETFTLAPISQGELEPIQSTIR